ncbi:MAG: hypothetical protein NTY19_33860 [Planctomycetota bacterium]|nr:hypothetical protein [Planctomycetota bacterium]
MRPGWPTYWFLVLIGTATLIPPLHAQDVPPRPAVEFVSGVNWQARFRGVDVASLQATQPRLMRGYAARIQVTDSGIVFLATPDSGDRPGETDGLRTTSCSWSSTAAGLQPGRLDS